MAGITGGVEIPAGGNGIPNALATAELYHPAAGTFMATGSMNDSFRTTAEFRRTLS